MRRVAIVGAVKSGVTSLRSALTTLGYHPIPVETRYHGLYSSNRTAVLMEIARGFDCLLDLPWALMYREIDMALPGTRFILTARPSRAIALSEWYWKQKLRKGWPRGNPTEEWIADRVADIERLRRNIIRYFRGRPLLHWDVEVDGWGPLCKYLGHHVPHTPFPHLNKTRDL